MHPKQPLPLSTPPDTAAGLDKVIETIRVSMSDNVFWLNGYVYGRARADRQDSGAIVPIVYAGGGEYINALPNDNIPAMAFFRAISQETTNFDSERRRGVAMTLNRDLSLIVWVNLQSLSHNEAGNDYIYTESLKEELYTFLSNRYEVTAIKAFRDESFEEVYDGYSLTTAKTDYLELPNNSLGKSRSQKTNLVFESKYMKWPFMAFRIDFTVKYHTSC